MVRHVVAVCLMAATGARAAGIRSGGNSRTLAAASTYVGCFADSKGDRVLTQGLMANDSMTPEGCNSYCEGQGAYLYYAVQFGEECWCGAASVDYDRLGVLEEEACDMACTGNSDLTCGGRNAFELYQYEGVEQPEGYLGCYTDSKDARIFSSENKGIVDLTIESCKTLCEDYAFYGLEFANECFCGLKSEDYTVLGVSTSCDMQCTGDKSAICGGRNAMSVFTQDLTATLPPAATPSPSTIKPSLSPVTVQPSPAPTVIVQPSPAPVVTGPVRVDLVPCILSPAEVTESTAGPYVMNEFFKGYWTPKTEVLIVADSEDLTPMMMVNSSIATPHGKCNAVYVGIVPSETQVAELKAYSTQYKVRIVYFSDALTHSSEFFPLGVETFFVEGEGTPGSVQLNDAGNDLVSISAGSMVTDLTASNLFAYPVRQSSIAEGTTVVAEYLDNEAANVAIITYTVTDGPEEMHLFFPLAWFDAGSWAWAHFIQEWASKGVFMGERRFYLGATVDDLFLATPEFLYDSALDDCQADGACEADVESRCSGSDLDALKGVQDALNLEYPGSNIVTEFAFNGAGILEKIESDYLPPYRETLVTVKGTKWQSPGESAVHDPDWLSTNYASMVSEFTDGEWTSKDDLLAAVISYLGTADTFYHGGHTLIHLSRDQLGASDCFTEDIGNLYMAIVTGMFDSDSYNWRSMVSPGITGLFNENCLQSAADAFMTCFPGDNTFDGEGGNISLLSDNPFHSLYTTVDTNGYEGSQIVPRFATYVYFNCYTAECLINENTYIRRFVCDCSSKDPGVTDFTCASEDAQCTATVDGETVTDIRNFDDFEELMATEAATTTRYMLSGRRDKYMFHQANIIPSNEAELGGKSLLEYWYERVMQDYAKWITFPVKSVKFDDLCTNFKHHESLDESMPYVTMSLNEDGSMAGMEYVKGSGSAGLVPLTVPTASAASIPTDQLAVYSTETYGSDTTYYLADSEGDVPEVATKPSSDDYPSTTNPAASTTSDVTENADIGTTVTNPNNEMAYADGLIIEDGGGLEAATLAPTSP